MFHLSWKFLKMYLHKDKQCFHSAGSARGQGKPWKSMKPCTYSFKCSLGNWSCGRPSDSSFDHYLIFYWVENPDLTECHWSQDPIIQRHMSIFRSQQIMMTSHTSALCITHKWRCKVNALLTFLTCSMSKGEHSFTQFSYLLLSSIYSCIVLPDKHNRNFFLLVFS
jgi:hypothetical protein